MALAISSMARNNEADITGTYRMPKDASGTAQIVEFSNNLFDSLNTSEKGSSTDYKGGITKKSGHIAYWQNAVIDLKNMYFKVEGRDQEVRPPCLKNFIFTIEGFIDLTNRILDTRIKSFYTRKVNQDCVENLFSQIRQHRGRLTNPTSRQFSETYKSLFLRHVTTSQSRMSNCEETFEVCLFQFENMLCTKNQMQPILLEENPRINKIILSLYKRKVNDRILLRILQNLKKPLISILKCRLCKIHVLNNLTNESSILSKYEPYFLTCMSQVYNISQYMLMNCNLTRDIQKTTTMYVNRHVHFSFMCDHSENVTVAIIDNIIRLTISEFTKKLNNIIRGKEIVKDINNIKSDVMKNAVITRNKRLPLKT